MGLFDAIRGLVGGGGEEDGPPDDDDGGVTLQADESEMAESGTVESGTAEGEEVEAGDTDESADDVPPAPSSPSPAADFDDLRAEFRPYAEDFAEERSDLDLDFSENSLVRLDAFVDERWGSDRFEDAEFDGDDESSRTFTGIVIQAGSYFGMTLVRTLDAEWVDDADFGAAVRVYGDDEDAVVNVFHITANCLRGSASFAETYDRATEDL